MTQYFNPMQYHASSILHPASRIKIFNSITLFTDTVKRDLEIRDQIICIKRFRQFDVRREIFKDVQYILTRSANYVVVRAGIWVVVFASVVNSQFPQFSEVAQDL